MYLKYLKKTEQEKKLEQEILVLGMLLWQSSCVYA